MLNLSYEWYENCGFWRMIIGEKLFGVDDKKIECVSIKYTVEIALGTKDEVHAILS